MFHITAKMHNLSNCFQTFCMHSGTLILRFLVDIGIAVANVFKVMCYLIPISQLIHAPLVPNAQF